jgi:hypothetical protein
VKYNGLIHYTSRWTRKNKIVRFPKSKCLIFSVTDIFQISDALIFKTASFWGTSIKAFPLPHLKAAGSTNENTNPKIFVSSPYTFYWGLINLWEIQVRVEWDPLCEHLSFMKQSLWHLLLLEVKPPRWLGIVLELSRLWWAVEKFVNVYFTSARKEVRANKVKKVVQRDPTWSWLLVGNSS